MSAPVFNLDDYRRTDQGVYVPASAEASAVDVEPAEVEQDQVLDEVAEEPENPQRTEPETDETGDGVTWRVRLARRGSAVQQRLAEIPARQVIRASKRNERAAALEEIAGNPRAEAYSNRRARFWLLTMAAVGIALGVGISASSAQQTITSFMGWSPTSIAGLAAYGADPALGLVLFSTLGARILASARGVAVPESAREALNKIEIVLFSLVALLNAGPSLGRLIGDVGATQWGRLGPDFMVLVIHTLGPVLVATGVFGVPFMAVILGEITAATNAKRAGTYRGVTPPEYRENAAPAKQSSKDSPDPSRVAEIRDELARMIADGRWTKPIAAGSIRTYFECGTPIAQKVRDQLTSTQ